MFIFEKATEEKADGADVLSEEEIPDFPDDEFKGCPDHPVDNKTPRTQYRRKDKYGRWWKIVGKAKAKEDALPDGVVDERLDPAKAAARRLRLTKGFSDDYGSYSAGEEFDVYPYGGASPKYATVVAPGRECTLQVPWDSVEVCEAEDEFDAEDERYEQLKNRLFSGSPMKYGELEELKAAAKARGDRDVESALENVVDDDAPAPEEKLGDDLVSEALEALRMMY